MEKVKGLGGDKTFNKIYNYVNWYMLFVLVTLISATSLCFYGSYKLKDNNEEDDNYHFFNKTTNVIISFLIGCVTLVNIIVYVNTFGQGKKKNTELIMKLFKD